jgi:16S rRNA (guanine527-N7)-methyltransferase
MILNSAAAPAGPSPLSPLLVAGLNELTLAFSAEMVEKLANYVYLLDKWNRVYNLTSVRDPLQMVNLHVLDSASVVPYIRFARTMVDVGTGAGLPGIPAAVISPDIHVTLLDTIAKKTSFVRQAITELRISNATVVTERVEKYLPKEKFDAAISRAFAGLGDFIESAGHLVRERGQMLAMKGLYPRDEIARVAPPFRIVDVHALRVPGLDAQRHLVVIEKS